MRVSKTAAMEVMIAVGWPSCVKWELLRLAKKVNELANLVDESDATKLSTPEGKAIFRQLLDASVRGENIEIVESEGVEPTTVEKTVAETPKRETVAVGQITAEQADAVRNGETVEVVSKAATSTPQAAKPADDGIDHSWDDIAGTVENQPSTAPVETATTNTPTTPTAAEPKRRGRPALTEEEKAARKAAKSGTRTEDVNWDSPENRGAEAAGCILNNAPTPGGLASPTVPGLTPEEMRLRQSAIEQEKAKVALPNNGKIPAPQIGPRGLLLGAIIAVDGLSTIDDGSATLYASLRQSESAARNGRADLMKAAHIIEGYLVAMAELNAGKDPLAKWVSVLGVPATPTDFIAN